MQKLYIYFTADGEPMTIFNMITNVICLMIFLSTLIYGVVNIVRFWKFKTYQTALFYLMAVFNLTTRSSFFIVRFIYFKTYFNLLSVIIPGICSLSVVISQTMIYTVLTLELSFYMTHRNNKQLLSSKDVSSLNRSILLV
jgi:hypothetical protein